MNKMGGRKLVPYADAYPIFAINSRGGNNYPPPSGAGKIFCQTCARLEGLRGCVLLVNGRKM